MIELTVGSRFYYKDKLCEVVEGGCCLSDCVLKSSNKRNKVKCDSSERHDSADVCFKEVEE